MKFIEERGPEGRRLVSLARDGLSGDVASREGRVSSGLDPEHAVLLARHGPSGGPWVRAGRGAVQERTRFGARGCPLLWVRAPETVLRRRGQAAQGPPPGKQTRSSRCDTRGRVTLYTERGAGAQERRGEITRSRDGRRSTETRRVNGQVTPKGARG